MSPDRAVWAMGNRAFWLACFSGSVILKYFEFVSWLDSFTNHLALNIALPTAAVFDLDQRKPAPNQWIASQRGKQSLNFLGQSRKPIPRRKKKPGLLDRVLRLKFICSAQADLGGSAGVTGVSRAAGAVASTVSVLAGDGVSAAAATSVHSRMAIWEASPRRWPNLTIRV